MTAGASRMTGERRDGEIIAWMGWTMSLERRYSVRDAHMGIQGGSLTSLLVLGLDADLKEYTSIFADHFLSPWGVIVISS